jgi:hypothetical protein
MNEIQHKFIIDARMDQPLASIKEGIAFFF